MDFSKYKNNLKFPNLPSTPDPIGNNATAKDKEKYKAKIKTWEKKLIQARREQKAFWKKEIDLNDRFRADAFAELGLDPDSLNAMMLYSSCCALAGANDFPKIFKLLTEMVAARGGKA